MTISIVIPSYNGWARLPALCTEIIRNLETNYEIIIVDDGSKSRSSELIVDLRNKGVAIKGVFLKKNYGQQFATLAGIMVSKGDYVFTVDDDLSHDPEYFKELLSLALKDNIEVVFGIPIKRRTGLLRKGGSGIRDLIFNIFFRKPKDVSVSSFRLLSRSLVNKILEDISEYRYLSVEILKHTEKIANKLVNFNRGQGDISRYSFIKLVFLTFSLIRCAGFFPAIVRRSIIASTLEYDTI